MIFKNNQIKFRFLLLFLWLWSSRIMEVVKVKNSFLNAVWALERRIQSSHFGCRKINQSTWNYCETWYISLLRCQGLLYENLWPWLFYFLFCLIIYREKGTCPLYKTYGLLEIRCMLSLPHVPQHLRSKKEWKDRHYMKLNMLLWILPFSLFYHNIWNIIHF